MTLIDKVRAILRGGQAFGTSDLLVGGWGGGDGSFLFQPERIKAVREKALAYEKENRPPPSVER
jgi:hypothetical protein